MMYFTFFLLLCAVFLDIWNIQAITDIASKAQQKKALQYSKAPEEIVVTKESIAQPSLLKFQSKR